MDMLIELIFLASIAFAALALVFVQQHQHAQQQAEWGSERRELLNRIQRPELVYAAKDVESFEVPEPQPDGWARVGEIESIDDSYGIDDDGS